MLKRHRHPVPAQSLTEDGHNSPQPGLAVSALKYPD